MSILVLTTEPLPLPGCPTTGAGMRAWVLTFGLRSRGIDAEVAFAADALRGREVDLSLVPGVHRFERGELKEFLAERQPDAIVMQHWGLMRWMPKTKVPLAIDLAGPHLLERALWGSRKPEDDLREKIEALARTDFVVCSGAYQRHYFLPFLFQAGFKPDAGLCPVIPFSVSPDPPEPDPERDLSAFLFSGFFLPWQDSSKTLEWALDVMERKGKGRLVVAGGPHPSGDVSGGRFDALLEKMEGHPRVERHGVLPFEEFLALSRRCGAALDLMARNPERELAYPTRSVVLMWAGLPIIHNDFDELAEPVRRAKAGWTLDPEDEEGFKRTFERLVGHSEDVARRSENARKFVQKNLAWDRTIGPLADWCRNPTAREEKRAPLVAVASAGKQAPAPSRQPAPRHAPAEPPRAARPNALQQALAPLALLVAVPIGIVLFAFFGIVEALRALAGGRR